MSIMDCLQPRTVTVKGARFVDLGSNKDSWTDEQKERRLCKNMTHDERIAYNREAKNKHRAKVKAQKAKNTQANLAKYNAGEPLCRQAIAALREKGLI